MSKDDDNVDNPNKDDKNKSGDDKETLDDMLENVKLEDEQTDNANQNASTQDTSDDSKIDTKQVLDEVDKTNKRLDAFEELERTKLLNADIESASTTVAEIAKVDPRIAKGHLYALAEENKKFAKVFEQRMDHPDVFQKALKKVGEELFEANKVKVDPQLANDQDALTNANNLGQQNAQVQEKNQEWAGKKDGEFLSEFNQLAQSG